MLVLGSTGLAGSAILRRASKIGLEAIGASSRDVDLTNREMTFNFLNKLRPTAVVVAAAKVGGIFANSHYPVDFLSSNLQIQTNTLDACHQIGVERLVFLGSSCIYPQNSLQPIKEEYLLTGPLERTNSAYATAKIAGIELVQAYRRQYDRHWISLMPTNLYGPGDNFDLENSHVLPALIRRFVSAKDESEPTVMLWGTGEPRREFLHADDFARAVFVALEKYDEESPLNVGSGEDLTIEELSRLVASAAGFEGSITWDKTQPNGVNKKLLDSSRILELGFRPQIDLKKGIQQTVDWFRSNKKNGARGM